MGLYNLSEIPESKGLKIAGPVPAPLQLTTTYEGALGVFRMARCRRRRASSSASCPTPTRAPSGSPPSSSRWRIIRAKLNHGFAPSDFPWPHDLMP